MSQVRRTISLSVELDDALVALALGRGESVSALLETLLREHGLVRHSVEMGRLEPKGVGVMAAPGRMSRLRKPIKLAPKRPSA